MIGIAASSMRRIQPPLHFWHVFLGLRVATCPCRIFLQNAGPSASGTKVKNCPIMCS
jgi:hypothetical protein